jgi:hypothetical protein
MELSTLREPLERRNWRVHVADRQLTGTYGAIPNMYGAGSALAQPAAETRTV